MASFKVDLVSPEKVVFSGDADMVIARTTDGEIAFQPGHVPFVGVLRVGQVKINFTDGSAERLAVHSGFIEVSGDHVTILSDVAELAADIDVARAEAARDRATAAMAASDEDEEAVAALRRAETRLLVASA